MNIKLELPEVIDLKPRIAVIGIGGAGCNAINNMIATGLDGVEFIAANTDAQALAASGAEHRIQLGVELTEGLGAGAKPEIGREAAEEAIDEIRARIEGCHMVFLAAGMGGGTGTGAISVIARIAREMDILTIAIVSKPFQFEGSRRMRTAEDGISELRGAVDTLIVIPNQNLFRIANEKTTFAEAFILADQVLYSGIACIVDLIIKDGLINLDFADVKAVMKGMGSAMMGTGEATGDGRATLAAEAAITNPLLDEISLRGARGLLVSIIGGKNLTLFEVDEAASRVKQEADPDANIIVGASFEDDMEDRLRVSIVASGLDGPAASAPISGSSYQHAGSARPIPALPPVIKNNPTPTVPDPVGKQPVRDTWTGQVGTQPDDEQEALPTSDISAGSSVREIDLPHPASIADDAIDTPVDTERGAQASPAPPSLPDKNHNADPYMGNTSVDEFARALSEVMGTVDDDNNEPVDRGIAGSSRADGGSDFRLPWHSADGVVIEDGLTTNGLASTPPPLPVAGTAAADHAVDGFLPQPPADLPRRVPDISEFPNVAQREYQSKTAGEAADDAAHSSGMPGILRRLARFGRQGADISDSGENAADRDGSSQCETHEDNISNGQGEDFGNRHYGGGNRQ